MTVTLLTYTPDADKLVASAAKLCYSRSDISTLMDNLTPDKVESFLTLLNDLGHSSPIEHASFTFGIEGVSRALLAQLTRHRIASFSVQSQRYVDKSSFEYITPPEIESLPEAKAEYIKAMEEDAIHYENLRNILIKKHTETFMSEGIDEKEAKKLAEKKANEDARFVLPNSCDTKIIMTMNVRSLHNFFSLRCCRRAQWEIRELAVEMLRLVRGVAPLLFAKAGPGCVRGKCQEGSYSCKKADEVRKELGFAK
ncbi:MAG: FAD-dependent thymidylate synthase [Ruminococcaceae bacterium]|nr:FAD-dependent thymidylate synthase [Oscillospiraceae bacterium]